MVDREHIKSVLAAKGQYIYSDDIMLKEHPDVNTNTYRILVFGKGDVFHPNIITRYLSKNGIDLSPHPFYMTLDEAITACDIYSGQETEWNDHD